MNNTLSTNLLGRTVRRNLGSPNSEVVAIWLDTAGIVQVAHYLGSLRQVQVTPLTDLVITSM